MSDDLIETLMSQVGDDVQKVYDHEALFKAAAARILEQQAEIAALEAELNLMKTSGIIEVTVRNPSVSEYMDHWEKRAEAAEAERDKLREALRKISEMPGRRWQRLAARAALAETDGE